ncbi:MAG TPA: hypothetical protein VGX68_19620 [Thermoanaerobaculia bacterium]|jgi:hypothetical protein|nr:hypothetical protein [Thermoanaerobaculia bacterium]
MSRSRLASIVGLVFLLVGAAAVAEDLRPLLKLHDRHTTAAGPANVSFVDQDLFVSRSGEAELISVNRSLLGNTPFTTTIAQGTVTPDQLAALNVALAAARPSRWSGECTAELFPLGSSFRITLSWFGNGSRTSTLTLTNDGTAIRRCSAASVALLQAVYAFEQALLQSSAVESSVCQEDLQCPSGLKCCYPCGIAGCENRCSRPSENGHCPAFP